MKTPKYYYAALNVVTAECCKTIHKHDVKNHFGPGIKHLVVSVAKIVIIIKITKKVMISDFVYFFF